MIPIAPLANFIPAMFWPRSCCQTAASTSRSSCLRANPLSAADNRVPHLLCAIDGCGHIRRQHESLTDQLFCGSRDLLEVIFAPGITLGNRPPGITCFLPVFSRRRERVEAADQPREVLQIAQ